MLNLYTKYTRRPRSVETTEWVLYITQCGDMIIFFLCISLYKYYKQLFGWHAIPLFNSAVFGGGIYAARYSLYQLVNTGIHKNMCPLSAYKRTHGPPKKIYIALIPSDDRCAHTTSHLKSSY